MSEETQSDADFWAEHLADGRPFEQIVRAPGIYCSADPLPAPPPGYRWEQPSGGLRGGPPSYRLWSFDLGYLPCEE